MTVRDTLNRNLLDAVQKNDLEMVSSCLINGADPNCIDEVGYTPIIIASIFDFAEVGKVLLDNGADKNRRDSMGWSATEHADFNLSERMKPLLHPNQPSP